MMQTHSQYRLNRINSLSVFILVSFFILSVCKFTGYQEFSLLLLFPVVVFLFWKKRLVLSLVDITIIGFCLFEIVSYIFSVNKVASTSGLITIFISILYYSVFRICVSNEDNKKRFLFISSGFIMLICLLAIFSFFNYKSKIFSAGFTVLSDFKHVFKPLGILSNVWSTYLLGFLCISILAIYYNDNPKRSIWLVICVLVILFNMIITFSRSLYVIFILITVVVFIGLLINKNNKKWNILKFTGILFIIFILISPFHRDLIKTLQMTSTVSQERSIVSRIDRSFITTTVLKENFFMGVGSGNYTLAINNSQYEDDNNSFTDFAPNIVSQILVEKGLVGAVTCMCVILSLLYVFSKRNKKSQSDYIIFFSLLCLWLREMSFPIFLKDLGMQVIIFTIVALFLNDHQKTIGLFKVSALKSNFFIAILTSVVLFISFILIKHSRDEKINFSYLQSMNQHKLSIAESLSEKMGDDIPYLINKSMFYWYKYMQTKSTNDLMYLKQLLLLILQQNPKDNIMRYNLATILWEEKRIDEAYSIFDDLVKKFPNNALFNFVYFRFCKEEYNDTRMNYLYNAICLNPDILESGYWNDMWNDIFIREGILQIYHRDSIFSNNPILTAKKAKLSLCLGDTVKAENRLKQSVEILPNLSRPWFYLGIISFEKEKNRDKAIKYFEKSLALSDKDFQVEKYKEILIKTGTLDVASSKNTSYYPKFSQVYIIKFNTWYNSFTLDKIIFNKEFNN